MDPLEVFLPLVIALLLSSTNDAGWIRLRIFAVSFGVLVGAAFALRWGLRVSGHNDYGYLGEVPWYIIGAGILLAIRKRGSKKLRTVAGSVALLLIAYSASESRKGAAAWTRCKQWYAEAAATQDTAHRDRIDDIAPDPSLRQGGCSRGGCSERRGLTCAEFADIVESRSGFSLANFHLSAPAPAATRKLLENLLALLSFILPGAIAFRYKGPGRSRLAYGAAVGMVVISLAILGASRTSAFIAVFATGGALLAFLGFRWADQAARESESVREEAARVGITSEEIKRMIPFFTSANKTYELKVETCSAFSLRREGATAPGEWAFLQRGAADGAQYPNTYLFRATGGDAPAEMQTLLRKIGSTFDDDYLEFEATRSKVTAFWTGPEGVLTANQVFGWLRRLAEF